MGRADFLDKAALFLNKDVCWAGTSHDSYIQEQRPYYILVKQN